jgi:radical SAM superfamily enzyme YgiQ (UPF0313 family)
VDDIRGAERGCHFTYRCDGPGSPYNRANGYSYDAEKIFCDKAVKGFLPHLARWNENHDYPFEFSTEASINLSDDQELMRLMRDANFFGVFVGIESPDPMTLTLMKKKQNTRRNIAESIHKIYSYGMFVNAGFILGFDSEKGSVADAIVELIQDAAIPLS